MLMVLKSSPTSSPLFLTQARTNRVLFYQKRVILAVRKVQPKLGFMRTKYVFCGIITATRLLYQLYAPGSLLAPHAAVPVRYHTTTALRLWYTKTQFPKGRGWIIVQKNIHTYGNTKQTPSIGFVDFTVLITASWYNMPIFCL